MAKVNVNSATRDEFIEVAGLKPQVADALLRLRNEHGGKVAGLDALKDLAQTTGASMDQLRDALEFGTQAAQKGADAASFAAKSGADVASFAAKSGAGVASFAAKSGGDVAKLAAERTAEAGQEAAQRTMAAVSGAEKQTARHSAEAATDISQLFVSIVNEQMQHNVEVLQSLARVRNWREALDVQNAYLRTSIERMSSGTTRYVEVVTKLTAGMVDLTRGAAKKAA